jgi:hypothetical protein
MANGIAGFGGLNFFPLVILSELTVNCVLGFGRRFERILENQ